MSRSIALVLLAICPAAAWAQAAPYAGQRGREIKALSEAEVRAYLEGEGMGYAKAAELNRYPGPRHALDAARELRLSAEQEAAIARIHARMRAEAVRLGERVVALERGLDSLFAHRAADADLLRSRLQEWGRLQGELRAVHLVAHVETTRLLDPGQIERYVRLRGYEPHDPAGTTDHRH